MSFSSPFTADTDDAENRSLYIGFFWKVEDAAGNLDVRLRDTDTVAGPRIVFGNNSGMIRAPGGGGQDLEAVVVNQWNYAYLTITESALHPTTGTHTFDVTIVQGDSINTYTDLGFHSTDVTGIGEFWFQMQEAGPHTGWIDEIRVQTTPFFDEVIPEPASVFLLAAGGLCAATRRRGTA